jgi:membrane-bound lytic murein transglycosylase B
MRPRLRSARRSLEIAVLELVARALRVGRRLRLSSRWVAAAAAAVLIPSFAVAATVVQHASAHPGAPRPVASPSAAAEPTPPSAAEMLDPALFQAAAKRPPAAPVLSRLPQVDLNGLSVGGIPRAALAAYVTAARLADRSDRSCHLRWWLLAGIGLVESGHAHSGGSGTPAWDGIAKPPIFGPRLDGKGGVAAIRDTDRGTLDRDRQWDRAVGPMQFLPSTWRQWGGADHGRMRDPQDIRAAALAAAGYLCASSADLSRPQGMATAVYSYNHSFDYVRLVLTVAARYAGVDPGALGVDRLPHDKTKKKAAKPEPRPTASPSPGSTAGTASGSPSPSSGGASTPAPSPTPTGTAPALPPVPTPTSGPVTV